MIPMRLSLSRRFRLAGVAIAAGALTLTLMGPAVAQAAPATVVPDADFAACLNGILGVADPAAPITQAQLQGLGSTTNVSCVNMGIKSIEGAQYLTNLTMLSLAYDQVSDISQLSSLANLTELELFRNQISNIKPLSGLRRLTFLDLDYNQIPNISALSGLTNLTWLGLRSNLISDASALSGLSSLDILDLGTNHLSDIRPLSGLTNLTSLSLGTNNVSNIEPLSGLTNLTYLDLSENQISDIRVLSGLTNLGSLELSYNQISDLRPLSGLGLDYLAVDDNHVSDLTPLSGLDLSWFSADRQSLPGMTVTAGAAGILPVTVADGGFPPVSWSVLSGSATISGTTFTPTSPGIVVLGWSNQSGSFTGTVNVTVLAPVSVGCGFVDVPSSNQYGSYICWMKTTGVTTGTTPTTYAPAANVTRGQMAAFMYRLAGSPTFNPPSKPTFGDVPASNEFFKQIEWLKHTGITTGTTPTTFAPTANVTRGQMAAFMYRLAGSPTFSPPSKSTFTDVPASNEFFKQIEWLKNTGITTGTTPTTYAPVANVTREQMAAFMYRLAQKGYYCTDYPGGANC